MQIRGRSGANSGDHTHASRVDLVEGLALPVERAWFHPTGPTLVTVQGAGGQGKTWLLRALYNHLSARDVYWGNGPLAVGHLAPVAGWPAHALMKFVWLGHQAAEGADALDDLSSQLERHAKAIAWSADEHDPAAARRRAAAEFAALGLNAAVDLTGVLSVPLTGLTALRDLTRMHRRASARRDEAAREVRDDPAERARRFIARLRELCRDVIPAVVVIDDVNYAEGARHLFEAITETARTGPGMPILVVGTVSAERGRGWIRELAQIASNLEPQVHTLADLDDRALAQIVRKARPDLNADQARRLARRIAIPKALLAAVENVVKADELLRLAMGAEPIVAARQVYERLWDGLDETSRRALLAFHVMSCLLPEVIAVPEELLQQLWREVLPSADLRELLIPLLRRDSSGGIEVADPSLLRTLQVRFEQSAGNVQRTLQDAALSALAPYAASLDPWDACDAETAEFLCAGVIAAATQGLVPPGEGAVLAAFLLSLRCTDSPEDARRHLTLAQAWLGGMSSPTPRLLVNDILLRAQVESEIACEDSRFSHAAAVLRDALGELSAFPQFNDRYRVRLKLAWTHLQAGQHVDAVRGARAAARHARHMGAEARIFETQARLVLAAALTIGATGSPRRRRQGACWLT